MSKLLTITTLLISFNLSANTLDLLPGLWKTKNTLKVDGKELEVQKQMAQAMALIPEGQRQQFMKAMEQQMGGGGMLLGLMNNELCVTQNMLNDPLSFVQKDKNCKGKAVKNTKTLKQYDIDCGSQGKGSLTWNIPNNKNYSGKFHGTDDSGKKLEIDFQGEFMQESCEKKEAKPAT